MFLLQLLPPLWLLSRFYFDLALLSSGIEAITIGLLATATLTMFPSQVSETVTRRTKTFWNHYSDFRSLAANVSIHLKKHWITM